MSEQPQVSQHFDIQKVYLKDVSLETPNSPLIFTEQWQPQTEVRLETGATPLTEDLFEVVLNLTITTKVGERTAYLAEVQQGGLFTLRGFDEPQMGHMLHAFCPNILFPFAREELASLVGKGGFPALLLNPINFDGMYLQRLQQQQTQAAGAAPPQNLCAPWAPRLTWYCSIRAWSMKCACGASWLYSASASTRPVDGSTAAMAP